MLIWRFYETFDCFCDKTKVEKQTLTKKIFFSHDSLGHLLKKKSICPEKDWILTFPNKMEENNEYSEVSKETNEIILDNETEETILTEQNYK